MAYRLALLVPGRCPAGPIPLSGGPVRISAVGHGSLGGVHVAPRAGMGPETRLAGP
jgi:hypothetical protein